MADLSPAAIAVRDAAERQTDLDFRYAPMIAAAALEAAANQVELLPLGAVALTVEDMIEQRIRRKLLAIAAELRGQDQQHTGQEGYK